MISALVLAPIVAFGTQFTCTPTKVWDGDGPIWCAEGPKVRLAAIAAREIDETCKSNQPCPAAGGHAARDYLVGLLGGSKGVARTGHILVRAGPMRCLSEGEGKGDRTAAWCITAEKVDLNCALVKSGYALRWARYKGGIVCRYPRW